MSNEEKKPREGDLRIWHNSNIGDPRYEKNFHFPVDDPAMGRKMLDLLAEYDLYQGERKVFANAQGLEIFEGGEWFEYEDQDGNNIRDIEWTTLIERHWVRE